jgi:adenine-specific DNA-methyltransferase
MNIHFLDAVRKEATQRLDQSKRGMLGQFMTPSAIAAFMASLFTLAKSVRLLDAGAGVGSLTAAFLNRAISEEIEVAVEAWEVDSLLRQYLRETLAEYAHLAKTQGLMIGSTIHAADFIEQAVVNLGTQKGTRFTHAILNPPYKKMSSNSVHRLLLRKVNVETVNLYAAFVALAILLMREGGEIVAIIPRSFCNGAYYRAFRELLLTQCAIRQIHLFDSRNKAFAEDEVLQENLILHLVKNAPQGDVKVTTSHDARFADITETYHSFDDIVRPDDSERFIHVPTPELERGASPLFAQGLKEIGLEVCTGPVVDFRVKDYWQQEPQAGSVPLVYPHHLADGVLTWPKTHKKPNALARHPEVDKWLMPSGHYVIVKRFSSKEERRRVVAYVISPNDFEAEWLGFENHWNVFHIGKKGLTEDLAYGLATFLNSTLFDIQFRLFSGHTQVNATDLRTMKYPERTQLEELGKKAKIKPRDQASIDALIQSIESST